MVKVRCLLFRFKNYIILVSLIFILVPTTLYCQSSYNNSDGSIQQVISTSLTSDEIIYSLLHLDPNLQKRFDIYYSYISANPKYSNIYKDVLSSKLFYIDPEQLFLKSKGVVFLSPYNSGSFLRFASKLPCQIFTVKPTTSFEDVLDNIDLISSALNLNKQGELLKKQVLDSFHKLKLGIQNYLQSSSSSSSISVLIYLSQNIAISSYTLFNDIINKLGIKNIASNLIGFASIDKQWLYLSPRPSHVLYIYSDNEYDLFLKKPHKFKKRQFLNSVLSVLDIDPSKYIWIDQKDAFCTSNYIVKLFDDIYKLVKTN